MTALGALKVIGTAGRPLPARHPQQMATSVASAVNIDNGDGEHHYHYVTTPGNDGSPSQQQQQQQQQQRDTPAQHRHRGPFDRSHHRRHRRAPENIYERPQVPGDSSFTRAASSRFMSRNNEVNGTNGTSVDDDHRRRRKSAGANDMIVMAAMNHQLSAINGRMQQGEVKNAPSAPPLHSTLMLGQASKNHQDLFNAVNEKCRINLAPPMNGGRHVHPPPFHPHQNSLNQMSRFETQRHPGSVYAAVGSSASDTASESYVNPLLGSTIGAQSCNNPPSTSSEYCCASAGGGYYYPSKAAALCNNVNTASESADLTYHHCHHPCRCVVTSGGHCQLLPTNNGTAVNTGASTSSTTAVTSLFTDSKSTCCVYHCGGQSASNCATSERSDGTIVASIVSPNGGSCLHHLPCRHRQQPNHYEPCCGGLCDDGKAACAAAAARLRANNAPCNTCGVANPEASQNNDDANRSQRFASAKVSNKTGLPSEANGAANGVKTTVGGNGDASSVTARRGAAEDGQSNGSTLPLIGRFFAGCWKSRTTTQSQEAADTTPASPSEPKQDGKRRRSSSSSSESSPCSSRRPNKNRRHRRKVLITRVALGSVVLALVISLCSVVVYWSLSAWTTPTAGVVSNKAPINSGGVRFSEGGFGSAHETASKDHAAKSQGAIISYDLSFRVTNEVFRSAYGNSSSKLYRDFTAKLSSELDAIVMKIGGTSSSSSVIAIEPFRDPDRRHHSNDGVVVRVRVSFPSRTLPIPPADHVDHGREEGQHWVESMGLSFIRSLAPTMDNDDSDLSSSESMTGKRSRIGQFVVDVDSIEITSAGPKPSSTGSIQTWTARDTVQKAPSTPSSTPSSVVPVWGQWSPWSSCPPALSNTGCSDNRQDEKRPTQVRRRKCHFWDQGSKQHPLSSANRRHRRGLPPDSHQESLPSHCSSIAGGAEVEIRPCPCPEVTPPPLPNLSATPKPQKAVTVEVVASEDCTKSGCLDGEICSVYGGMTTTDTPKCRATRMPLEPYNCGGLCSAPKGICHVEEKTGEDGNSFPILYMCIDPTECVPGEWRCESGLCIPGEKRCDGHFNCYDKTDEFGCNECSAEDFHCGNGTSCLPLLKKCNGIVDCWDGSDESSCGTTPRSTPKDEQSVNGTSRAGSSGGSFQQLPGAGKSNFVPDADSDRGRRPFIAPKKCSSNEFTCRSGQCVQRMHYCDGFPDCFDRTDEPLGCGDNCKSYEFTCKNGRCIQNSAVCDGTDDCGDYTDEATCSATDIRDRKFPSSISSSLQHLRRNVPAPPRTPDLNKVGINDRRLATLNGGTVTHHQYSLGVPKAVQLLN